mmetsp:Transcript_11785/g.32692  ORF Transcript_11785/g.32692 Transcript_11785/m.32692 type:complete len:97 (+) Transcript_11785:122-412(+)
MFPVQFCSLWTRTARQTKGEVDPVPNEQITSGVSPTKGSRPQSTQLSTLHPQRDKHSAPQKIMFMRMMLSTVPPQMAGVQGPKRMFQLLSLHPWHV